jgi:hypothetical protein
MQQEAVFPRGEVLREFSKHEDVVLATDLRCSLKVKATGVLVVTTFQGSLEMEIEYRFQSPDDPTQELLSKVSTEGEFEFQLK